MQSLFSNMDSERLAQGSSRASSSTASEDKELEESMRKFFEEMMRNGSAGLGSTEGMEETLKGIQAAQERQQPVASGSGGAGTFQDKIKATHDKIRSSDATARVCAVSVPACDY